MKCLENKKEIINIAKEMLLLKIIPDEKYKWAYVHHPFAQSNIVLANGKIFNLSNEKEIFEWQKQVQLSFENLDFFELSNLVANPYKLAFLKKCISYLDNDDIAIFFAKNWRKIEYPNNDISLNTKQITNLLIKCKKELLMNVSELKIYNALPSELEIYRGVPNLEKNNEHALSWTLDKKIANSFALNFEKNNKQNNPIVLTKKIKKKISFAILKMKKKS